MRDQNNSYRTCPRPHIICLIGFCDLGDYGCFLCRICCLYASTALYVASITVFNSSKMSGDKTQVTCLP